MLTSYDEVAYPSNAFRQTHPGRLAAHAHLFGLPYAPFETARVLDIGAGDGANIIPMALAHPNARFVGFDLSTTAVARGQADIAALGLKNIDLFVGDICDIDLGAESFDYTIAHGVYSWVPDAVRDATLALNRRCLAPHGVAFVSYNAFPGCRIRQIMRDMLRYAVRDISGTEARMNAAVERLREIVETFPKDQMYGALIIDHAEHLLRRKASVLSHDELGEEYFPVHLHEFVTHISRHSLQFLTEADAGRCGEGFLPPYALDDPAFDVLAHAQNLDFLSGRPFRQSLIVHEGIAIDRVPRPERLFDMHVTSTARRTGGDAFIAGTTQFELKDAILERAVEAMTQAWPGTIPVSSLIDDLERAGALLRMYWTEVIELHTAPLSFPGAGSSHPCASPVARLQAARGQSLLTALNHGMVEVEDSFSRQFIAGLDGSRSRKEIAHEIAPALGGSEADALKQIEDQLEALARMPLLVG